MAKISVWAMALITFVIIGATFWYAEDGDHIDHQGCKLGIVNLKIGQSARYNNPCMKATCYGDFTRLVINGCPDSDEDFKGEDLNRQLWPFCCDDYWKK
uniref:Putative secreted protein n=1 Tax=Amblyomma americanum TaxID=6943 RepID=A0A0C9SCS3_AMBAM